MLVDVRRKCVLRGIILIVSSVWWAYCVDNQLVSHSRVRLPLVGSLIIPQGNGLVIGKFHYNLVVSYIMHL